MPRFSPSDVRTLYQDPKDASPEGVSGRRVRSLVWTWVSLALIAASFSGSIIVAAFRYTRLQEHGARTLAFAGASGLLLGFFAIVGLIGAIALLVGGGFRGSLALLVPPVVLALLALGPTGLGLLRKPDHPGESDLSVLVQNLWYTNDSPLRTAEKVVAQRAQVMVLVEFDTAVADAFAQADSARNYPYRWSIIRSKGRGIAVYSKVPFTEPRDLGLSGPGVSLVLNLGHTNIELLAVHVNSPTSIYDTPRWKSDLSKLTAAVKVGASDSRRIVAGDLNATDGHIRFRKLVASGQLSDAQDVGGGGFVQTWPLRARVPPFFRLDHVLVGQGLKVERFEALPHVGSDHRGLMAWVSVR